MPVRMAPADEALWDGEGRSLVPAFFEDWPPRPGDPYRKAALEAWEKVLAEDRGE